MSTMMKNMVKGAAVGMIAAGAVIGGLVIKSKQSRPKIKKQANQALRAAGSLIERLTEMTE